MARIGSSNRAQRQARRQQQKTRTGTSVPPESTSRGTTRASRASFAPSIQESTAHIAKPQPTSPSDSFPELDDEFFRGGSSAGPHLNDFDDEGEDENPALSPAQYQRRRQLRRLVAILMTALALFSVAVLLAQVPR